MAEHAKTFCLMWLCLIISPAYPKDAENVNVRPLLVIDTFSSCVSRTNGLPCGWHASRKETKMFSIRSVNENVYLQVRSDGDATSIARRLRFTPDEYPVLRWKWRIWKLPEGAREDVKKGGDSVAGVYVIFAGKLYMNRILKYVWSSSLSPGTNTQSPYNSRTKIIVLRSGNNSMGVWISEKVDISRDFRKLFGTEPPVVEAVGLMSDSDNTKSSAWADYDDLIAEASQ